MTRARPGGWNWLWAALVLVGLLVFFYVITQAPTTTGGREPARVVTPPTPLTDPPAVIVWVTEGGIKDGTALLRAGQLDLAAKYVACVVPPGTRAVRMTGGYDAVHITIVEGESRGCRGYVMRDAMERLAMDR